MKDVPIKPYIKKYGHSYSFGVYPTLELLKYRRAEVIKVLLHTKGKQNDGVKKIIQDCQRNHIKFEYADGVINKLSNSENTYAVGVFQKYKNGIEVGANHLVLVNPEDMGNLGTIIRTAIGFGVKNLAIIKPGVDCFDPKVVRSSMGSLFQINIEYFDYFEDYKKVHKNKPYLFMIDGDKELSGVKFQKPFSLVFGSESAGLDESMRKFEETVFIKQSKGVDSLNLSISVGVALYESMK